MKEQCVLFQNDLRFWLRDENWKKFAENDRCGLSKTVGVAGE